MAKRTKAELKSFFETGDLPTQSNFEDFIDSSVGEEFADYKFRIRKNKALTYDPTDKKMKVVGSDAAGGADDMIFNLFYEGVTYAVKGLAGTEQSIPIGDGNAQIGFLKTVADPGNVQLSDFVFYNDTTSRTNFVKLAHIVYNDGVTSDVIKDYRNYYPAPRTAIEEIDFNFISKDSIRQRKRKWLAYDRTDNKLKVVGLDGASAIDDIVVTIISRGVTYIIRDFVGTEVATSIGTGNSQILISRSIADPSNIRISDILTVNATTDFSDGYVKLAHVTFRDGITSNVIVDMAEYEANISSLRLRNEGSFVNNSIGENLFANGDRTKLKIMALGNSYMRNSVHLLSQISAQGVGVDLTIGNLYTGGTQLHQHLAAMTTGAAGYLYAKYENGVSTLTQSNQTVARGLKDERWDVVILHQYFPWTWPMQPKLSEVMAKVVEILGYCPKFYINATWATHEDYVLAQNGFATEAIMWEEMLDHVKAACEIGGISVGSIIPTGTAIENARTLSFADSYNRFVNAGTDWHHLNSAGGFIAACAIYEKIVSPLNGVSCVNTNFRITTEQPLPPSADNDSGILVNESNYLALCQSAVDAIDSPFTVTSQV